MKKSKKCDSIFVEESEKKLCLALMFYVYGKIKENYLKDAISEYSKRLSKYCNLNIIEVPDEKIPSKLSKILEENIKDKEAENMIAKMPKDTYLLALDLNGKEYTSEQFSKKIEDLSMQTGAITFIIGGTLGISKKLLEMSKEKISFSKMTFPHQLMRLFLLEQIFRAFKISNNETYHR